MEWLSITVIVLPILIALWAISRESHREMKDFHGRLCTLEQKYIDMMERILGDRKR